MKTIIHIQDVCKSYGKHQVLSDLCLDVYQGQTLVILGRSGVGKSVLLRLILGLEALDSGLIQIDGICRSYPGADEQRAQDPDVGMLFQGSALFDSMTIGQNVMFALSYGTGLKKFGPLPAAEKKERAEHALELVGLAGTFDIMPSDLSGGMKRRAALARLLVHRPKILLYDEPTAGLDPITSIQISELIVMTQVELQATSIVVTHDLGSALLVGERLALHQGGRIAYVAEKEAFIRSHHPLVESFLKPTKDLADQIQKLDSLISEVYHER
jgi:phospholipid/cholesterol/gamma-HCH transport system ATP-binding protein